MEDHSKYQISLLQQDAFMNMYGVDIDQINPEKCILSLELKPNGKNYHGTVHGAVYYGMADCCAGAHAHTDGRQHMTLSGSLNFIKTITEGRLYCESTILHQGRTTSVLNVNFWDEDRRLLASGTYSYYCITK